MPQTEAQRRAKAKYNAKAYDRLEVKVLKGNKDIIKAYCNDKNTSLNALINSLLTVTINRRRLYYDNKGNNYIIRKKLQ